ncbi:MAG: ATP phosphoribosyltransferase [Candidatus Microsaccharimonas sp.]
MEKTLKKENLKIAIQKDGRLTEESLKVLKLMGLDLETYGRRLFATCRNFPVEVLFCRDDDIPGYVESGVADLGIVGKNIIIEEKSELSELMKPGFGYCRLMVAVPKESTIQSISDLEGKSIATSFPTTTKQYFDDQGINVKIVQIAGAVEITPALGVADAISDITATGSTMILNDLRPIETILETEAVIVAGPKKLSNDKQELLDQMLTRLEGVIAARSLKYVMMNAPKTSLEAIKQITPGLNAPTVTELARSGWIAIHAVIDEDKFWQVVPKLKNLGAEGILVLPIEKIVL